MAPMDNAYFSEQIKSKLAALRKKVLDLSSKNPLVSMSLSSRSGPLRVVNEIPDVLVHCLRQQASMKIAGLPPLDDDPPEERTRAFREELRKAIEERAKGKKASGDLRRSPDGSQAPDGSQDPDGPQDPDDPQASDDPQAPDAPQYAGESLKVPLWERNLRDKIRIRLGLPPRPSLKDEAGLIAYARSLGMDPSYDLPSNASLASVSSDPGGPPDSRLDHEIQTLLFPRELEKRLEKMLAKYRTFQEETGLGVLFAAIGILKWTGPKADGEAFSPILLLPLAIERKKTQRGSVFTVHSDGEDISLNFVLAEILKSRHGVSLDPFDPNDPSSGVSEYLEKLSKDLSSGPLGKAAVLRQVALGLFPYDGMAIYEDLDPSRPWYSSNPMVKEILIGKEPIDSPEPARGPSPFPDPEGSKPGMPRSREAVSENAISHEPISKDAAELGLVQSADSSQIDVIASVLEGRDLAVEGPPGTGKSQTIVNVIALALSRGQKVLFIAEKLAALEVVKSRLEAIGLGDYLLPLQANRSSRAQVLESIKKRLAAPEPKASKENPSDLLALYLQKKKYLEGYVGFLDAPIGLTGLTTWEILGRHLASKSLLEPLGGLKAVPSDPENVKETLIADIVRLGDDFQKAAIDAERLPAWAGLTVETLNAFKLQEILNSASDAAGLLEEWSREEASLKRMGAASLDPGVSPDLNASHAPPSQTSTLRTSAFEDPGDLPLSNETLEELRLGVDGLVSIDEGFDPEILLAVFRGPGRKALEDYLASAEEFRGAKAALSDVADPESSIPLAKEAVAIAGEAGIEEVDPDLVLAKREALEVKIKALSDDREALIPIVAAEPRLAKLPLEKAYRLGRLARECGRAALALRGSFQANGEALAEARDVLAQAEALLEKRRELASIAPRLDLERSLSEGLERSSPENSPQSDPHGSPQSWSSPLSRPAEPSSPQAADAQAGPSQAGPSQAEPSQAAASQAPRLYYPDSDEACLKRAEALESAGLLSFLSGPFREAKRWWKRVSDQKFSASSAAAFLRSLLAFRQRARLLAAHPLLQSLQSRLARGGIAQAEGRLARESPIFEASILDSHALKNLQPLADYVEKALASFPPLSSKDALDLAENAPLEALLGIPEKGISNEAEAYSDFEDKIAEAENLKAALQKAEEKLRRLGFKPKAPISAGELALWKESAEKNLALGDSLDSASPLTDALGAMPKGRLARKSDFAPLLIALEVLERAGPSSGFLASLAVSRSLKDASRALARIASLRDSSLAKISEISSGTGKDFGLGALPISERARAMGRAGADSASIFAHSRLAGAGAELRNLGYGKILPKLLASVKDAPSLGRVLEAGIYEALASKIFTDSDKNIDSYLGGKLDEARKALSDLDERMMRAARDNLRRDLFLSAKPPEGRGSGPKRQWTEMALLHNEAGKRKNLLGLRKLVPAAARALLELKPCWMMSPTAVSQYLVGESVSFDLAILDEASQMPPQNAVPSLARCRRCVIVGDQNQLPPTTFFKKMIAGDAPESEDELEDEIEESILEMARTVFRPSKRLLWHYRSRHSALIEFSNQNIYDGSLVVYPSPSESRPGMGVELVFLEGIYKSSVNRLEAEAMVEAAMKFMRESPLKSLGLVTLNHKQRELVSDLLEKAMAQSPHAAEYEKAWLTHKEGLEKLFVKNLENVQGDERDCVFIGTVYGPAEKGGPVANRFGPVSGKAGRNRLNVLLTRAKERIVTFTSMAPEDIKTADGDETGAGILKKWLKYAKEGGKAAEVASDKATSEASLRGYVAQALASKGHEAEPSVGTKGYRLDLAVKSPNGQGYALGLETDGPQYRQTESVRDRDKLRDKVLEKLGWNLARLWTTEWINTPERELSRLESVIEAAMTEAPPSKPGQEDPAQSDPRALGLHGWSDQAQEALAWPVKEERAPRKGIDRERIEQGVIEQGRIGQEKLGQEKLEQEELRQESAEEDEYDPIVEIGDMVEIHFQGNPESAKRFVVGEEDAVVDGKTIERVRVNSPLGRALLDASLDDDVEYLVGASAKTATIARIVKGVAPRETRAAGPSPSPASKPSSGPSPSPSTGPPSGEASSPPRVASGDPPRASGGAPYDPALSDVYDEGLTASLAEWLCDLIDKEGPVRLDCLLKLAAQAHGGLKRVTGRFKSRVASVLEGLRTATETNGETVYWPRGRSPEKSIPYRKFDTDGRRRGWEILPYPERLGLALKAVGWSGPAAMKASIGFMLKELGRSNVPQSTRAEMAVVVKEAIKELG